MPPRRPLATLPFALLAVGVGLCLYYVPKWQDLPRYTEAQIESSVDYNLLADLARRGSQPQPSDEELQRMREQVRAEVLADIDQERSNVEAGLGLGLIATIAGLGNLLAMAWLRRRGGA